MNRAGPFVLGSQDNSFLLDDTHINFPEVPSFVFYLVDWVLSRRHQGAWRFNYSDMYGNPRPFPNPSGASNREYRPVSKGQEGKAEAVKVFGDSLLGASVSTFRVWWPSLIFSVSLLLCIFAAMRQGGLIKV
jgi:hypothetical protein